MQITIRNRQIILMLFSCILCIHMLAQKDGFRYRDVDSLINSSSIIDNMDAIKLLKNKYAADSMKSDYWIKYAKAYNNSYKPAEALTSINKAIQIDNRNSDAYFEKARLIAEKDLQESIFLLDSAITLNKNGMYYFYRGIYYQMIDSSFNAKSDYESAIQTGYKHEGLYRNFSILLLLEDHPEKALTLINRGIEEYPENAENYKTRGEIYVILAEPDQACSNFKMAIEKGYRQSIDFMKIICPADESLNKFSLTGDVLIKIEKYSFAINAYNKSINENPNKSVSYLNRGYCYFMTGDYTNAEQDYLMALTLPDPDLMVLYDNLSLLYFEQNKFEKSIEYSTKLIESDPSNHVPYIDRGLCYRKLKKYKNAEADFNHSLKIKPDFFRAYGYRAFLFMELGQYEKAYEDASKSVEINSKYGYGYLVLAQIKQMLNLSDFCTDYYNALKYGEKEALKGIEEFCE